MVTIDSTLCTGCGKCVADCIAKNLRIQEKKAVVQKECFLCGHCVNVWLIALPKTYASRRKKQWYKKNVFYADIVSLFVLIMQ